jgi:hypothetical protein
MDSITEITSMGRIWSCDLAVARQQFHRHRGAFALSAGELVNPGVGMAGQLQLGQYPAHRGGALLLGGARQPQFGGIAQGRMEG